MKQEKSILLLLLLTVPILLSAQHSLRKELNSPRDGDEFVKTEMNFFMAENGNTADPEKKEKKSWNLLKLKEKEKKKIHHLKIRTGGKIREATVEETIPDYTVTHTGNKAGNILSRENNTLFHRKLSGDTLLETGCEDPHSRMRYTKPLPIMLFPMKPGTEQKSTFTGRGVRDDRVATVHTGTVAAAIDEFGELILPSGDTLHSIVRVHERKEEQIRYETLNGLFDITAPVNRDSVENSREPDDRITTNSYRWYEEGYRYPVFETVQSYRILKDKTLPVREATYVYAPYEQEFLKEDVENEKVKREKEKKDRKEENKPSTGNGENEIQAIEYHFYPNPVTDVLNLKFRTQRGAETIISLYELSGREVLRKVYPAGNEYKSETCPVSACPAGTYVLRISCGNRYAAEMIVKQ